MNKAINFFMPPALYPKSFFEGLDLQDVAEKSVFDKQKTQKRLLMGGEFHHLN